MEFWHLKVSTYFEKIETEISKVHHFQIRSKHFLGSKFLADTC